MGTFDYLRMSTFDTDQGILYSPPAVSLDLYVIDGVLTIRGRRTDSLTAEDDPPLFEVDVDAAGLQMAIKTLRKDDRMTWPEGVAKQMRQDGAANGAPEDSSQ
jgi:hypothetical protein